MKAGNFAGYGCIRCIFASLVEDWLHSGATGADLSRPKLPKSLSPSLLFLIVSTAKGRSSGCNFARAYPIKSYEQVTEVAD